MRVLTDTDLAVYAPAVLTWLAQDPVANNVLATVIGARLDGLLSIEDDMLMLRVVDRDRLAGVALRTPPSPMLLSAMPAGAAHTLAAHIIAHRPGISVFNGPTETAHTVASQVAAARGATVLQARGMGRFRLDKVIPPPAVRGHARIAIPAELSLLHEWAIDFHRDIGGPTEIDSINLLPRIQRGSIWIWQDGMSPVAMAATSQPAAGVVRINLVFTPKPLRGHGYASTLVAHVAQRIIDNGHIASLYTDLANPTSNKIYQAIGFWKVDEAALWEVGATADTADHPQ